MPLIAHSSELSLFDLVQLKGQAPGSCRISVRCGPRWGVLFLRGGRAIFAAYAQWRGADAAYALLTEPHVEYEVTSDVSPPAPNMDVAVRALVFDAARLLDERRRREGSRALPPAPAPPAATGGATPAPALPRRAPAPPQPPAAAPPGSGGASSALATPPIVVLPLAAAAPAPSAPAPAPAPRKGPGARSAHPWLFGLVAVAVIGVVAILGVGLVPHTAPTPLAPLPAAPTAEAAVPPAPAGGAGDPAAAAVEASSLTGDADARPVLAQGSPPPSPSPEVPLRPTIVCRILVDASGSVARAEPYAARSGMEAFEAAAVAAVKSWRFAPARKAGSPVAAWVNWPVTFQPPPHP